MSTLVQAFKVQKRVVGALLYREIRGQYGATRLGFLWALITPMATIAVFSGIFWTLGRGDIFGSDFGSIVTFITTGFLSYNLFTNISTQVMNSNKSSKALFGYPLVMPFDAMIARLILSTIIMLTSFALTLALLWQLGFWKPEIDSLLSLMGALTIASLFGFGVGLINSYLLQYFPSFSKTYGILTRPLLFMSGIFYLASDRFPPAVLNILYYNPILHCTEWVRSAFYTHWESSFIDFNYVLSVTLTTLLIGLVLQRLSQKRARE